MRDLTDQQRAYRAYMSGVGHAPAVTDELAPDDRAKRNIKLATQALSDAYEEGRSEGYAEALASHTCETVWRPTTTKEIQLGWEVRSRRRNGYEATWGVAHHQGDDGDWRTEVDAILASTILGWTYETTAPLPEPEPWDEELVGVVSDALAGTEDPGPHWDDDARRVLDALAARGYLDRATPKEAEQ